MSAESPEGADNETLATLHETLATHFAGLRDQRDGGAVFALEHGLPTERLSTLEDRVRSSIRAGVMSQKSWLPFVVYATEVGYRYSGDQYWQTFEAETPGWTAHGDRNILRGRFRSFASEFNGSEPRGAWAKQFSIIAWPITHAVLPKDLQRRLAELLFTFRRRLTSALLADPDELGEQLALHSWHTSERFKIFAQDHALLGRVSAALMAGELSDDGLLYPPTLDRIVRDLNEERQARQWLAGARARASEVLLRGFTPRRPITSPHPRDEPARPSETVDPQVQLRRESGAWRPILVFPDLSSVAARLARLDEGLRRRRVNVSGADRPLAQSRLLSPNQIVRLDRWPEPARPLLTFEGDDPGDPLLVDQVVFPPGPTWLFKIGVDGVGREIRGKHLRPAAHYVLVATEPALRTDSPWISPARLLVDGAVAVDIRVPQLISNSEIDALGSAGLGIITDVSLRPAGIPPADWNGEGRMTWLVGDSPVLAISSSRNVTEALIGVDEETISTGWPQVGTLYLALEGISEGVHTVATELFDENKRVALGYAEIVVRPPAMDTGLGDLRQGLRLVATPPSPTLEELVSGDAHVAIDGPPGVKARLRFELFDHLGESLAHVAFAISLPSDEPAWSVHLTHAFRVSALREAFDAADSCRVSVAHELLGEVAVRIGRKFAMLRWVRGRDGDGPYAYLVDHLDDRDSPSPSAQAPALPVQPIAEAGARPPRKMRHRQIRPMFDEDPPDGTSSRTPTRTRTGAFSFASPATPLDAALSPGGRRRLADGGLLIAFSGGNRAETLLSSNRRGLALSDLAIEPRISTPSRTPEAIARLLQIAGAWTRAPQASNALDESFRETVLRSMASTIALAVCGDRWATIEHRLADRHAIQIEWARDCVGAAPYQRAAAAELEKAAVAYRHRSTVRRAEVFRRVARIHCASCLGTPQDLGVLDFVIRLATAPGTVVDSPAGVMPRLALVIASPVLLRAARFYACVDAYAKDPDAVGLPETWSWT